MDNDKKLFENLLKADGIDADNITDDERSVFKAMLDSEQKHHKRLSWQYVAVVWIFAMAFLVLRFSLKILDALHIPFFVAFGLIITVGCIVMILFGRKLSKGDRKVSRLQYLTNDTRRGIVLVGKKNGRRFIYWPRVIAFAVKSWLAASLSIAGAHYLLHRQWIYSSSSLRFYIFLCTTVPLSAVIGILYRGLKTPIEELVEVKTKPKKFAIGEPNIWRIIMNSKITKYAVAAIVMVALVLSITLFDKTVTPAYAIQRTIEAYNSIRFLQVKQFKANHDEPLEFWIKTDDQGNIENARYYLPEHFSPGDGAKLLTWSPQKGEIWFERRNRYFIFQSKKAERWIKYLVLRSQPKLVMQNLLAGQKAGIIELDIQTPNDKQEPVTATVTDKAKPRKTIYYINQATDLITSVETYEIKDGSDVLMSTTEYYDYNVPIDDKMFSIADEVSEGVTVVDQLNQLIGIPQGDMTYEEAAVETVRQLLQALIDHDYKKVGLILGGISEEMAKGELGRLNVTRIISVGPETPYPQRGEHSFSVPCEFEVIAPDGQKTIVKRNSVKARCGEDEMHPDRWIVHGGF